MTSLLRPLATLAIGIGLLSAAGCHCTNDWTAAMHSGCPLCGSGDRHGGRHAHHTKVRPDVADQPSPGQFQPVPTRPVFFPNAVAIGPDMMSPPVPETTPPQQTPPAVSATPFRTIKPTKTVLAARTAPTPVEEPEEPAAEIVTKPSRQTTWVASTASMEKPTVQAPIKPAASAADDGWRARSTR